MHPKQWEAATVEPDAEIDVSANRQWTCPTCPEGMNAKPDGIDRRAGEVGNQVFNEVRVTQKLRMQVHRSIDPNVPATRPVEMPPQVTRNQIIDVEPQVT